MESRQGDVVISLPQNCTRSAERFVAASSLRGNPFRCARYDDVCFPHAGYFRYRGASLPPQRHRATRPRGECRSPRAGRSSPERVVRCDRWGRVEG